MGRPKQRVRLEDGLKLDLNKLLRAVGALMNMLLIWLFNLRLGVHLLAR
jgi:hypothetical protein